MIPIQHNDFRYHFDHLDHDDQYLLHWVVRCARSLPPRAARLPAVPTVPHVFAGMIRRRCRSRYSDMCPYGLGFWCPDRFRAIFCNTCAACSTFRRCCYHKTGVPAMRTLSLVSVSILNSLLPRVWLATRGVAQVCWSLIPSGRARCGVFQFGFMLATVCAWPRAHSSSINALPAGWDAFSYCCTAIEPTARVR